MDWFYNGTACRSQKVREISLIGVIDVAAHRAYNLSVKQTPAQLTARRKHNSTATGLLQRWLSSAKATGAKRKYDGKEDQLRSAKDGSTQPLSAFSRASSKRVAFNDHLLERFMALLNSGMN